MSNLLRLMPDRRSKPSSGFHCLASVTTAPQVVPALVVPQVVFWWFFRWLC